MPFNPQKLNKLELSIAAIAVAATPFVVVGVLKLDFSAIAKSPEHRVAEDQEKLYEIAKESGKSLLDRCGQAAITAQAYLNAKDREKYDQWKDIEKTDCDAAGLPTAP